MRQPIIFEDVIDERLPMQVLDPLVFDTYMGNGWRLLGYTIIRHNFAVWRSQMCGTIPLRIRLQDFQLSRSQRQLLRRNADLEVSYGPIQLTTDHDTLFQIHSEERFSERRPLLLSTFIGAQAHVEPVTGQSFTVRMADGQAAAFSFMHLGEKAVSGTYCFFHPNYSKFSLGTYTLLLEILKSQELGMAYYYPGYCYDVPSQFDYKLNFNALEAYNWKTGDWEPQQRLPVRNWADLGGD
jgi:leucyl-tRNA---protein transferase